MGDNKIRKWVDEEREFSDGTSFEGRWTWKTRKEGIPDNHIFKDCIYTIAFEEEENTCAEFDVTEQLLNGKAVLHYNEERPVESYHGMVANNLPHGDGSQKYRNGSQYTGKFVTGVKHGHGRYISSINTNHKVLEGEWENDTLHG